LPAFQVKLGANDLNCVDVPLNPTHSLTYCSEHWYSTLQSLRQSQRRWAVSLTLLSVSQQRQCYNIPYIRVYKVARFTTKFCLKIMGDDLYLQGQGVRKLGVMRDFSELREFCATSGKNCNKQSIFSSSFKYLCKTAVDWVNSLVNFWYGQSAVVSCYIAGVDVEWSLMKVIITFTFRCDYLWKSKLIALEKPGKLWIFSPTLWLPCWVVKKILLLAELCIIQYITKAHLLMCL